MEFEKKSYEIIGKLWLWNFEKGSWHFFTIPKDIANEIHFAHKLKNFGQRRGFGAVKVCAQINDSKFETSIFPNSKDQTYVLPVNAKVRKVQNIGDGDEVKVTLSLKDI